MEYSSFFNTLLIFWFQVGKKGERKPSVCHYMESQLVVSTNTLI